MFPTWALMSHPFCFPSAPLSPPSLPANVCCAIVCRIFAVLLFMYELVRVMGSCERPKQIMTKNFGFFFGAKGRGLYLIL